MIENNKIQEKINKLNKLIDKEKNYTNQIKLKMKLIDDKIKKYFNQSSSNRIKFTFTKINESKLDNFYTVSIRVILSYSGKYVSEATFFRSYNKDFYNRLILLADIKLDAYKYYNDKYVLFELINSNINYNKTDLQLAEIFINTRKFLKRRIKEQYKFINEKLYEIDNKRKNS